MEILDKDYKRDSIRLALLEKESEYETCFKEMLDSVGVYYYREYPFYKDENQNKTYYVDFLIKDKKVIIEIDGFEHKKYNDYDRDYNLFMMGYYVYRIRNEDVGEKGLEFINRIVRLHNIPTSRKVYKCYITWYQNTSIEDQPIYMAYSLFYEDKLIHEGMACSENGTFGDAILRCIYSALIKIPDDVVLEYFCSTSVTIHRDRYDYKDESIKNKTSILRDKKGVCIQYIIPFKNDSEYIEDLKNKMKENFGIKK